MDMIGEIYKHMNIRDRFRISRVNKQWREKFLFDYWELYVYATHIKTKLLSFLQLEKENNLEHLPKTIINETDYKQYELDDTEFLLLCLFSYYRLRAIYIPKVKELNMAKLDIMKKEFPLFAIEEIMPCNAELVHQVNPRSMVLFLCQQGEIIKRHENKIVNFGFDTHKVVDEYITAMDYGFSFDMLFHIFREKHSIFEDSEGYDKMEKCVFDIKKYYEESSEKYKEERKNQGCEVEKLDFFLEYGCVYEYAKII